MTIKPVLVPDHDAVSLRGLMDRFADASTGPTRHELAESRAAVAAAQGVAEAAPRMSANIVPGDNLQKLASAMAATIIKDGWDNTFRSLVDFYDFFGDHYGDHPAHDVFFDLDDKSQKVIVKAINKQVKAATGGDGGAYNGERNFEEGVAEGIGNDQKAKTKIIEMMKDALDKEARIGRGDDKSSKIYFLAKEKFGQEFADSAYEYGALHVNMLVEPSDEDEMDERNAEMQELANKMGYKHINYSSDPGLDEGVAEARPDVMRHRGDTTVRVVKKGGKPIGEIGTDAEASSGNGPYYVKLYDGSYDAVGFDTAEEALAELKYAIKQMSEGSLTEFAPSDSGDGGGDDDGFDEDTLRKLAAQWFAGDEDPQVERLLAAAGWEIGQDEGYDDEPGVFVVMSGDDDGRSYISWPAEEMRSAMSEGPETGIGSKLPKSDIETFGLQKGRPYKLNPPQDFKPGDRKRAVQQLIPTQDKKDHIRSRLGKHVAPALPESDAAEHYKDTRGTFVDRMVGEIMNYRSLNDTNPKFADLSSAVKSKLKSLGKDRASQMYQQALKQAAELSGKQGVTEAGAEDNEGNPVVSAILRRILHNPRHSVIERYGARAVMDAVKEVADFVGDVEEIGSSDVSGWVRHVEQMLGNMESDVTEQQVDELSPKTLGSYIKKSSADAAERQGEVSGRNQFGKGAEFAVKAFYGDRIQPNPTRTDPRIAKRQAGVDQAVDRLTAEDVAESVDPIEQLRADIRRFAL
jgi:hypothetical protein